MPHPDPVPYEDEDDDDGPPHGFEGDEHTVGSDDVCQHGRGFDEDCDECDDEGEGDILPADFEAVDDENEDDLELP